MNELETLLSNGHYVYYKSLQNSKLLSNVYTAGSTRVSAISSILNNTGNITDSE